MLKKRITKGTGEKIYQYRTGEFLPDTSQPSPSNPTKYTPHKSTRYVKVTIGVNGFAQRRVSGNLVDTDMKLPELYVERINCCGCTACYAICPVSGPDRPANTHRVDEKGKPFSYEILLSSHSGLTEVRELTGAITMLPDEEGFLYPVIDAEICIRCYKCLSVCVFRAKSVPGTIANP